MAISTAFIILIGVIALSVGIGIGILIFFLIQGGKSEKSVSASIKSTEPAGVKDGEIVEIARLLRDRVTGRLVVETGGRRLKAAHQLSAAQHETLVKGWDDLRLWLGKTSVTAPVSPATQSDVIGPLSGSPVDMLVRALQTDIKLPAEDLSIVAQIDAILQRRLNSGDFSGFTLPLRGIRLVELPGHRMVVSVGQEQYSGIDEVPDPAIQVLIRSCVAEWEQNNG